MAVFANAGVPMLFVGLPYMAAVFLPIVLLEACWYRRFLRVPWPQVGLGSLNANFFSFCSGLPVAWVAWALVGSVSVATGQASLHITREMLLESNPVGFLCLVAYSGTAIAPLFPEKTHLRLALSTSRR